MQTGASLVQSLTLLDDAEQLADGKETLGEAFWRTLIANLVTQYSNGEVMGSSFRSFCQYYLAQYYCKHKDAESSADIKNLLTSIQKINRGWLPLAEEVTELSEAIERDDRDMINPVAEKMWIYVSALRKAFVSRVFFLTRNGRMGIGYIGFGKRQSDIYRQGV
ncbi:hypothetical protein F4781DRAFT_146860 [Annulohypoxylon bovei var. microspora]|nr:hypothetical protein F4781DRAFT_146860 [Annulohypoxylon bovei var. microspora]